MAKHNSAEWNFLVKNNRLAKSTENAKELVFEALENKIFKAVTVCFSDIEGRLHMLDYDKNFLKRSYDNLTFDGSSIRGFTSQCESDLKIQLDWAASYIMPFDVFGPGKIFIFGDILDKNGLDYSGDIRAVLRDTLSTLAKENMIQVNVAAEIEGFLFKGKDLEQNYKEPGDFQLLTTGGYFNTLPNSPLRQFIDLAATTQRFVGFENEKDHPEVAPSQFEVNWSYTDALVAADQIQLYKMICRQIAANDNLTACFLPKPIVGVNGNGMHINMSFSDIVHKQNMFYGDQKDNFNLSKDAWTFIDNLLYHAKDICLALNSSVNSYRRLDPQYEAPNEIKASDADRGSMIRIPVGNEKSARIEVRTVAPDANPYLAVLSILKAGLEPKPENFTNQIELLPLTISAAINHFNESQLMIQTLGEETHQKYIKWKKEAADRCPKKLGSSVKMSEIIYHHEVTNQQLWNSF